jgi:acyl-CoA synthetase (AMP-forming)/AMP-acid ligase II
MADARCTTSDLAIGDWVTMHARYQPDADCLIRGDGSAVTYGAANDQVTRLARALQVAGLRPGDRIGILATDSPEYVLVQLASMKLGTTFVALSYRLSPSELINLLQTASIAALFASGRYAESVAAARTTLGARLRLVAWLDDAPGGELTYADFLASVTDTSEFVSTAGPEDILSLALTSGTTSLPKGVLQSQRMIRATTIVGAIELGIQPDDLIYSGAPLFHISGIGHLLYGLSGSAPRWCCLSSIPRSCCAGCRAGGYGTACSSPAWLSPFSSIPMPPAAATRACARSCTAARPCRRR